MIGEAILILGIIFILVSYTLKWWAIVLLVLLLLFALGSWGNSLKQNEIKNRLKSIEMYLDKIKVENGFKN